MTSARRARPWREPPREPEFELPPLPKEPAGGDRLSGKPSIVVREFRVTGSTVFSGAEFEAITAPYTDRPIASGDLQELRDTLTLLYVNAGYVNSGAVLPDQEIAQGVVEFRIVEGALNQIEIEGNRYFRDGYLRDRLELGASVPLDVRELEHQLQILQQDPRIQRVNAQLRPGTQLGDGVLHARFEEERPYRAWLDFSNYEPPSVGAYRTRLRLADENLTGNGDILGLEVGFTDGYDEYEVDYAIPVNRHDTTFGARWEYDESSVVEHPFEDDDIRSKSETVGVAVRHPLYRSLRNQLHVSLAGEYRESETFVFGEPFSFPPLPEADHGKVKITVLRFAQEWLFQDLRQVVAARSMFSVGLDLFGATTHGYNALEEETNAFGEEAPNGQFLAWLGQFQWVRRFDPWGVQVVFRTDVQLAADPLVSLEQFAVGGHATVRGYRENELVRDNGLVSSIEARLPLWSDAAGRPVVQLAPFFDAGSSWNTDRPEVGPKTISAVGIGLRFALTRYLEGQIYWGEKLRDVATPEDHDLQDDGVQFQITAFY